MFTTLYIKENTYNSKIQNLISYLKKNRIEIYYRKTAALKIKCIDYQRYKRKIDWKKIDKAIGDECCKVLCNKNLQLPKELLHRYFDSCEYKQCLCKNTAIHILKESKKQLSVGIVDYNAAHTDLAEYLIKYTDNIVVITQRYDVYTEVAETLLEETGAPISIYRTDKSLSGCDMIIALSDIQSSQAISKNTVVLTMEKYNHNFECLSIYDYVIDMPKQFVPLCPQFIERTEFAAALYSLCNVYTLGSLVPMSFVSNFGTHTIHSLETLVDNIATKT